jgi:cell division protein FtsL
MREIFRQTNKFYLTNFLLIIAILTSIVFMFTVQFSVESLQDEMATTESQIISYEDEIKLLEIEWSYLTRPERIRILASKYLKDNSYTVVGQIKDVNKLGQYYLANYNKYQANQLVDNSQNSTQDNSLQQVSF